MVDKKKMSVATMGFIAVMVIFLVLFSSLISVGASSIDILGCVLFFVFVMGFFFLNRVSQNVINGDLNEILRMRP